MMNSVPIILITGANTGLGFETIKALLRSSNIYTVLLGGRSIQKAEDAVQTAKSQFPNSQSSLSAIQVDIEDDASIANAYDEVSTKYGRVDVLINNAGKPLTTFRVYMH
jgi:NAD(P)-dependent dehydrogenase (short-subunit alcohol dehydrogenase family)